VSAGVSGNASGSASGNTNANGNTSGMRGIAASWVVTGDAALAPIAGGALVLDADARVVAVGEAATLRAAHASARWEEQRAVLLPGLVNAHTHLELSALRGQVPGGRGFGPWVAGLMQARERIAPEQDGEALDAAVSELLAAGTAAVGEVSNTLASVPALAGAPLLGCVFHEVFGMRRDAAEVMLGLAQQRRAEIAAWPANLRYAPAPHTPHTLHPEILREVVSRARALGQLTSIHLCENSAERAFLRDGSGPLAEFLASRNSSADWSPPGIDPVRYVATLGALAADVVCVHLTEVRVDEIALVARAGAPVVLCPRSNLHIEVKLPPLIDLLAAGIQPGLGTDSLASNASLDVLDEARALAERFPSVAARTLLAMATSWGARALALDARVGTLAQGLAPGVVAFEHDGAPPADPERFVLSRAAKRRTVLARPGSWPLSSSAPEAA
jgi:cytosine/adenosine deaminase-related metal-dependent hydrolase